MSGERVADGHAVFGQHVKGVGAQRRDP
jgi:hypothetical protein